MTILVNSNTRVLVQGITGREGAFHTKAMKEYGTKIVAGVTPGKGGSTVEGVPVYDSVGEAVRKHPEINASIIFVPARFAADAVYEAIDAGIELIVVIT
ncbi:MAG: succinate--CoA ligase subunit alpha, partial [Nitrososphaerota archaeon]